MSFYKPLVCLPYGNVNLPNRGTEMHLVHFTHVTDADFPGGVVLSRFIGKRGDVAFDQVVGVFDDRNKMVRDGQGRLTRPRTAMRNPLDEGGD